MARSKSFCLNGLNMAFKGEAKVIHDTGKNHLRPLRWSANKAPKSMMSVHSLPLSLSFVLNSFLLYQSVLTYFF